MNQIQTELLAEALLDLWVPTDYSCPIHGINLEYCDCSRPNLQARERFYGTSIKP